MAQIQRVYLKKARLLYAHGYYCKSYEYYVCAVENNVTLSRRIDTEFCACLDALNHHLMNIGSNNHVEQIFRNFECALVIYPLNMHIYTQIGLYLFKFGYYSSAEEHFDKILKHCPSLVTAEKGFNSLKNVLVERWHYRMLNDRVRNRAYEKAMMMCCKQDEDKVLDIGTGTGLLAMYAVRCQPLSVTACEMSELMAQLASKITTLNNTKVSILNMKSTELDIEQYGSKCSLVVTEMFDAGLFGEHVLQTLVHAWDNLLETDGRVIPQRAEFFAVGASSPHLSGRYQLSSSAKAMLNIPELTVHITRNDETYDSEDVHLYNDVTYVTDVQSVVKVDFNDKDNIKEVLESDEPYKVQLKAMTDGEINVIIGWFKLYLTNKITITTHPTSLHRADAWQQAVFFDNSPKVLRKGETLDVKFLINGGRMTMMPWCNSEVTRISQDMLRFLNDSDFAQMILKSIGSVCIHLGQRVNITQIKVVDLCSFPFFGLHMMIRGANSLVCQAKDENDRDFIKKVFEKNNVLMSKVVILVGDEWSLEHFKGEKYHAICCNILETGGDIDQHYKNVSLCLKEDHLFEGGLFLPHNIEMVVQLVYSPWVNIQNRVYDDNVGNYKIAAFINKYVVTQNFRVDLSRIPYQSRTRAVCVGSCSNPMMSDVIDVDIMMGGKVNAILCWYNIEFDGTLNKISTNRPNSFIDGTLFVVDMKRPLFERETAHIRRWVDPEGSFKLVL